MNTTTELKDWQRPYFAQAADHNLAYFVIYGSVEGEMSIPGLPYRALYMPQSFQLSAYNKDNDGLEILEQFRNTLFADLLEAQHPELLAKVKQQSNCFVVQVVSEDTDKLNDLRVAIGIATYLLDSGCIAAFDLTSRKWWTPQEWRKTVFEPEEFNVFPHVDIKSVQQDDGTHWVYSLGMRKFGRPDLSIHQVTDENMPAIREMIERFINFMALGGNITEGQEIRMKGLPEGMTCKRIEDLNSSDFGNKYVEVLWPK